MNILKKILLLIAITPIQANAWWFGNYDDCVLDNMKEGLSVAGVNAVKTACRNKYPFKQKPLSEQEKANLDALYKGMLECGFSELTQEEIQNIKLQETQSGHSVWNGNDFEVDDLAFSVQYTKESRDIRISSTKESLNKSIGYVDKNSSMDIYGLPSDIYAYEIIRATKNVCK
jgi:hypothetical protein